MTEEGIYALTGFVYEKAMCPYKTLVLSSLDILSGAEKCKCKSSANEWCVNQ